METRGEKRRGVKRIGDQRRRGEETRGIERSGEQRIACSGTIRSEGSYSHLLKRFLAQALPIALLLILYDDWHYRQDRQSRSSAEAMELYGFFVHYRVMTEY